MCRGGVALPRLTFDFFVGDMSPSSMPPSKLKPSTPSGEMKLGEARLVGVDGSAPRLKPLNVGSPLSFSTPKTANDDKRKKLDLLPRRHVGRRRPQYRVELRLRRRQIVQVRVPKRF